MFGDNFGGGGGVSGGGGCGGYDYGGGCSYQPVYEPVHVHHYPEAHFSQPCYDDSFQDPAPELEQTLYDDSYDDVYDARADVPLPAEQHAGDTLAHNATTASHRLGAAASAEAQALMERVVNEAIAAQERHMAQEAAEAAAEAAALADASKPGLFAKIRGVFGLR
ncbi:hypothetical protein [Yanghanlia caeni]|uniref:Uncharacterized protein n=1 Tax=Yanghanlia caeni TaxID=3064283 RepID=A0ABU1D7S9_9BURK|nr:hypothetical protein [Alcaligenaceae bacterium LG-2]